MPNDDPTINRLRASLAANTRWANETDRSAATSAARRGLVERWEREVDPEGKLSAPERAKRIAAKRKAHMQKMALASAVARRKKKAAAR